MSENQLCARLDEREHALDFDAEASSGLGIIGTERDPNVTFE